MQRIAKYSKCHNALAADDEPFRRRARLTWVALNKDVLDVRFDYPEGRFICYGEAEGRVWVCVFTIRDECHRVISVRKANERETRRCGETPR